MTILNTCIFINLQSVEESADNTPPVGRTFEESVVRQPKTDRECVQPILLADDSGRIARQIDDSDGVKVGGRQ